MKLSELIGTKEVRVRGTDIVITVSTDFTWADWLANRAIENDEERGIDAFIRLIRSWNIEGDDGAVAPVSPENVRKLPTSVAIVLLEELNAQFFERDKKKAD